mmetsp:Transcript_55311/g.124238  ORF Transcript_55311/g.124238 Transcript_55311/m.124238 type:complete len:1325 (-) Transcript_55311:38-4012(-)
MVPAPPLDRQVLQPNELQVRLPVPSEERGSLWATSQYREDDLLVPLPSSRPAGVQQHSPGGGQNGMEEQLSVHYRYGDGSHSSTLQSQSQSLYPSQTDALALPSHTLTPFPLGDSVSGVGTAAAANTPTFTSFREITPTSTYAPMRQQSRHWSSLQAASEGAPDEMDEVQMPKFLSYKNACDKQPSMLASEGWRESPMLKTLISGSNVSNELVNKAELDRLCDEHMSRQGVIAGGQIMVFTNCLAIAYRSYIVLSRLMKSTPSCSHWPSSINANSLSIALTCAGEACWSVACLMLFICSMRWPGVCVFYLALFMFFFYIIAMSFPPLALACDDIIYILQCDNMETLHVDCGLQGGTHMMLAMILIFLSPHIMPHRSMLVRALAIYLFLYCGISVVTMMGSTRDYYDLEDIAFGFALLSILSGIALYVKHSISKKLRDGFMAQHTKVEASKTMLTILEYMLPTHLVLPMLKSPSKVFADHVAVASVLFVEVVHFNRLPVGDAGELLKFLNALFTFIDTACEKNAVTKVETVGEEYVACVGVVPADQASTLTFGHSRALARLIRLGSQLLRVQDEEEVVLRMGLHTGPLVAGVIGTKLPRFRLFGDTMNTAARMMQTGLDGELQFGQPTLAELTKSSTEVRATRREGLVEMKGKGKVPCYLLSWRPNEGLDVRKSFQELHRISSQSKLLPPEAPAAKEGQDYVVSETSNISKVSTRKAEQVRNSTSLRKEKSMPPAIGAMQSLKSTLSSIGSVHQQIGKNLLKTQACGGVAGINAAFDDSMMSESSAFVHEMTPNAKYQLAVQMVREQQAKAAASSTITSARDAKSIQDAPSSPSGKPSMSMMSSSSAAQETDGFQEHYYINKVGQKITHRLTLHMALFVAVCAVQALLAVLLDLEGGGDRHPDHLTMFGVARFGSFFILVACRITSDEKMCPTKFVKLRVTLLNLRMVVFLLLTFLSLSAFAPLMARSGSPVTHHMELIEAKHSLAKRPLRIRIWTLLFLIEYLAMLVEIRLPSRYVIFYVLCVGIASMSLAFTTPISHLHSALTAEDVGFFIAMSLIGLRLSRVRAQHALVDYKASRDAESTATQIEGILKSFLPPRVLEELKTQNGVLPVHTFKQATIAQADLVGFTSLASAWNPDQVVGFISDLFGRYDELTDHFKIWKIETVGDAYIAGQADPPLTDINLPTEVVRFALSILRATAEFINEVEDFYAGASSVSCRVGVHTGECIGGIVGERMQRYHLFGDLLTELDLVESTAGPGRVHVSNPCFRAIQAQWASCEEVGEFTTRSFQLVARTEEFLTTSKGKTVHFEQVGGGPTYLVEIGEG